MKPKSIGLVTVGVLIGALGGIGGASAVTPSVFYGCLKSGSISSVSATDHTCKKGYSKISWGSQGVTGLQGPAGIQGEPGIQGPAGPAGPKGDRGSSSFTEIVSDTDPDVRVRVIDFPRTVLWESKLAYLSLDGQLRGQTNGWNVIGYSASGCTGTKYLMTDLMGRNYLYEIDGTTYKLATPASTNFGNYASFQKFDDVCLPRSQSSDLQGDVQAGSFFNLQSVTLPDLGPMHFEY